MYPNAAYKLQSIAQIEVVRKAHSVTNNIPALSLYFTMKNCGFVAYFST
jgi:hypothetical protein